MCESYFLLSYLLNCYSFFSDEKFSKTILLIDDSLKIHIFPKTQESITHLREKLSSIYLHLIDQESNNIMGYKLVDEKDEGRSVAGISEVWSVNIPKDQAIMKVGNVSLNFFFLGIFNSKAFHYCFHNTWVLQIHI